MLNILSLNSKDSLNGKPKKAMYFTAWLKMNGILDTRGISSTAALNLPSTPTDGSPPYPHFTMDMYQTRLMFGSSY